MLFVHSLSPQVLKTSVRLYQKNVEGYKDAEIQ